MSRQYDNWIYQQLEPTAVIITGNRKRYKPLPPMPNQPESSKRLDKLTMAELKEIEEEHLKRNGIK